jgi:hypothetical protein
MDLGELVKAAQKMQEELKRAQEALASRTVEGEAGAGMVVATANGRGEIVKVKIEPQAVDPRDVAMLEDLVAAAVNVALRKAREMSEAEMARISGGLRIPGLTQP